MRIWADCDDKCLPLVCVDVSLGDVLLAGLIAAIFGHLVNFGVPICNANVTIPFGVCPSCDLTCGSEKCTAGLLRMSVHMHLAVGKLLSGLMLMSIAFLLSLLGSGCTVHDLGFRTMEFFVCALQKTDVLGSL